MPPPSKKRVSPDAAYPPVTPTPTNVTWTAGLPEGAAAPASVAGAISNARSRVVAPLASTIARGPGPLLRMVRSWEMSRSPVSSLCQPKSGSDHGMVSS